LHSKCGSSVCAAIFIIITILIFEITPNLGQFTSVMPRIIVKSRQPHFDLHLLSVQLFRNEQQQILQQQRPDEEHVIVAIRTSSIVSSSPTRLPFRSNNDADYRNNNVNKNKDKLIHSTFRIRETVVEALSREAEKRGISLSTLVNKTLQDYVTSELYFEQLGFLLVSKDFLRKTFSRLDQKDMEELGAEIGITVAREYVSYFFPKVTADTLVEFLDLWFRRFHSYQHRSDNNKSHYFVVNHDINMNFSIALKAMLQDLIEPILKETVLFGDLTSNSLTFSFSK
jgi:hypothetical protein